MSISDYADTISIHAAREGGDCKFCAARHGVDISIHAAREGGDVRNRPLAASHAYFNPRRP